MPCSPNTQVPYAAAASASSPQEPLSPRSPAPTGSRETSGSSPSQQSPSRSIFSFLQTPEKRLIEAAKRGDDEEVSDLLTDGANVNTTTTLKKETPLHKASQYGNVSSVLLLLANGADPRALGSILHRIARPRYHLLSVARDSLSERICIHLHSCTHAPLPLQTILVTLQVKVCCIAPLPTPQLPSTFQAYLLRANFCNTTFLKRTACPFVSVQLHS